MPEGQETGTHNQTENQVDPLERYSRQMRFGGIGRSGQEKIAASRVVICGCGALGTVLANNLVRAGVGFVRIVDRDFVEWSNLQRQVLFDENDVREQVPKAVAAVEKLKLINSQIQLEAIVADIDRTNILQLCSDTDLILDGSDNFEVRYLMNDAAVSLKKPWIYAGCVGSYGQSMTIIPGETPCLRCVFEASPGPGEVGTCETAGVLGPVVNLIASYQSLEALKFLTGKKQALCKELFFIDLWENTQRRIKIAPLLGKVKCPCCGAKEFSWLNGDSGSQTIRLCGRNAVQVSHRSSKPLDFNQLGSQLKTSGEVQFNKFLLKFKVEEFQFTVFPDGRAIIQGTDDTEKARTLYAKYIGY